MNNIVIIPIDASSRIQIADAEHPRPFQCKIEIQPHQSSNEVEHVNNIEFLKWIDRASQLHCDSCGWERNTLLDAGMMWFVARHEIDYRSEALQDDDLLLSTWVEDVRRVKSWRTTSIHALNDKHRLVCNCRTLWVLVDLETRRPISIPKDMANSFDSLALPRIHAK